MTFGNPSGKIKFTFVAVFTQRFVPIESVGITTEFLRIGFVAGGFIIITFHQQQTS